MNRYFNPERPHFWINVVCEDVDFPEVRAMDNFLHNLNLIYEISRLATDTKYQQFPMDQLMPVRGAELATHLRPQDRLYVERISKKSPMELATVVLAVAGAIGGIWGLVQTVEKLVNFRRNRQILEEQLIKLQLENARALRPDLVEDNNEGSEFLFANPAFLEARLKERDVLGRYQETAERLRTSQIEIAQVEIRLRNLPRPHNDRSTNREP